ncbi:UNVERIFIED_CONTAM: hypothetical protein O8I53_05520 [Campylobacter lari]
MNNTNNFKIDVAPGVKIFAPFAEGQDKPIFTIGSFSLHIYSITMMLGILAAILTIVIF